MRDFSHNWPRIGQDLEEKGEEMSDFSHELGKIREEITHHWSRFLPKGGF
jgi:hypothetical protein